MMKRKQLALLAAGFLTFGNVVHAADGFEVGNGQGFGTFYGYLGFAFPELNGLYGKRPDKLQPSKTRLRKKTYKEVRYDSFRELRLAHEPKGFESIRADNLDAMEREGLGHGEGRCAFEIRFLDASQSLVHADYEAFPTCTIEQAMTAVKDSLESANLIQ